MLDIRNPLAPTIVGGGLAITVGAGVVVVNNSPVTIPQTVVALTASTTNFVYIATGSSAVSVNTTGFPANSLPIATVVTNGNIPTSLTDNRPDFTLPSSSGGLSVQFGGGVTVPLTGVKFPAAYQSNLPSGDTDLYTVPANKKALLIDIIITNPTGNANSPVILAEIKTGGVYHTFDFATVGDIAGTYGKTNAVAPFLFAAGETLSVNCNQSGDTVWPFIVEFDSSVSIFDSRLFSLSPGNNTVFTVPTSKTVVFIGFPSAGSSGLNRGRLWYWNNSGGARTITANAIPNGGSASVNNQIFSGTISGQQMMQQPIYGGLASGDFLNVNTDAATATQTAWVIYTQLP